MATRYEVSRPPFVADWDSVTRDTGHTMDWDEVADSYKDSTGKKFVPAGTPMGKTANGIAPARAAGAEDDPTLISAVFLLATHAHEGSELQNRSGYGVIRGGVIYENLLPKNALTSAMKTQLNTAGVSTGFAWTTYGDSTAS